MKANRIESAREALLNFGERDGDLLDCYETDITDLIADLLHLAEAEGVDPKSVLRMAKRYWEEERVDERMTSSPSVLSTPCWWSRATPTT